MRAVEYDCAVCFLGEGVKLCSHLLGCWCVEAANESSYRLISLGIDIDLHKLNVLFRGIGRVLVQIMDDKHRDVVALWSVANESLNGLLHLLKM